VIEAHLRKLRQRHPINADEEAFIRESISDIRDYPARATVVSRGQTLNESLLLFDGWAARQKVLPNGDTQISELHIAGDFVDLHGFSLKQLDHDVVAMSRCRFGVVKHARLVEMIQHWPHLTRIYWFATNLDAAIYREWTVSLGQRNALARTAHLFCELLTRHRVSGLADGNGFALPLTQEQLSQCLGLTPVHLNRVLQDLRGRGTITLGRKRLAIDDLPQLQEIAEFEADYLFLEPPPFKS
jgi:CRP-like cAMP-binding protein